MIYKILAMIVIALTLLTGCGSDGSSSDTTDSNVTLPIVENNTTVLDFNNSMVIIPTIEIPFEGGDFNIKFIPQKDKNLILEEFSIMITKTINGFVVDSSWADIYYDVTHGVYIIEAMMRYPYNPDESSIASKISMVYYMDGNTEIFQEIDVKQMGNQVAVPTVTANYEQFTVVTDENGDITITENPPNDFIVHNITDDDYINIAEALIDITVSGVSKPNASISYILDNEVYSSISNDNGIWDAITPGSVLAGNDAFTVTAVGITEDGITYTETALSRHLVKTSVQAAVYIDNITPDNNVSIAESAEDIYVSGYVTGDLTTDHNISLLVGAIEYPTNVVPGGTWNVIVPGSELHNHNTTTVTATGIDIAKNPILETSSKSYSTE